MKFSKEIKIGLLTVVSILLLYYGFHFLKGKDFLSNNRTFYAVYNNVEGLTSSAPVTINGLRVGNIDNISFLDTSGKLLVQFHVDEAFKFSNTSLASVYSTGLIGGKALAIVPDFESTGPLAQPGDTLQSNIEKGLQGQVMKEFLPLKDKIENMIVTADSVLQDVHETLNPDNRMAISKSLAALTNTLTDVQGLTKSTTSLIADNREKLDRTITNLDTTTQNFAAISDTLAQVEIASVVGELENSISKFNGVLDQVTSGEGSLGKLMTDDALYKNLERTSRQAEMLLQDLKLNPKRYVHFSVFGKKPDDYEKPENRNK